MKHLFALLFASTWIALSFAAAPPIPTLEPRGIARQLIVDGQPFLVLGGELHNSSSTSRTYMQPIWPRLAAMNLNTVLAVVPWDMVEPVEGTFDFTLVDHLVEDARAHNLRLVLLWFGSWKNGFSHYVPEWVKRDASRFPRAKIRSGTVEILSTFSEANAAADAKAFAAFMRHLRSIDEGHRTVIMVQVENEVGLHGDTRDRHPAAEAAFQQPVPRELLEFLASKRDTLLPETRALWQSSHFKTSGTWSEVFGRTPAADEAFMGWSYARYVDRVAAAGKAEYALPMLVNAWIVQLADELPGDYPSGGPQGHMLDLWRAGAPHIDLLSPDIYRPEFTAICAEFTRSNNALFVPESRAGAVGAANAFITVGRFKGIGYSPFGIESREDNASDGPIHHAYGVLQQLTPLILEHQTRGTISAVSLDQQNPSERIFLNGYALHASRLADRRSNQTPERAYGLILATGPDEFIVAGSDLQISFATDPYAEETVGLGTVEEGVFQNGTWIPGRRLNGDEIMLSYDVPSLVAARQTGTGLRFPGAKPVLLRVKLYRFR
jgi:beta-galactosidase GanA